MFTCKRQGSGLKEYNAFVDGFFVVEFSDEKCMAISGVSPNKALVRHAYLDTRLGLQGFSLFCSIRYRRTHFKNHALVLKFSAQDTFLKFCITFNDRGSKVLAHSFTKSRILVSPETEK